MDSDPDLPPRSGGPSYSDPELPPAFHAQSARLARLSQLYPFHKTMPTPSHGGPAFPQLTPGMVGDFPGMTLRDYFAAKALQGALANDGIVKEITSQQLAPWAYEVADLMLQARQK